MPRIKGLIILLLIGLLTGCVSRHVNLYVENTVYDGIVAQSISFEHKGHFYQWVCYSELQQQLMVGISCQNDTALQLFSGGLVNDVFEFEYPSRYLLKIPPKNMLAYIKMSLFEKLEFDGSAITIIKSPQVTSITDNKRKVKLTIHTL